MLLKDKREGDITPHSGGRGQCRGAMALAC